MKENLLDNHPCKLATHRWDRSPLRTQYIPWPLGFEHNLYLLGHSRKPQPEKKMKTIQILLRPRKIHDNFLSRPKKDEKANMITCLPPNMISVVLLRLSMMDSRQEYKLSNRVLMMESLTFMAGDNNFPDWAIWYNRWTPVMDSSTIPLKESTLKMELYFLTKRWMASPHHREPCWAVSSVTSVYLKNDKKHEKCEKF